MSFEIKWPPIVHGEMFLNYKISRLLTYSISYWDTFFRPGGEEQFPSGRFYHREKFPWRGKFSGLNFSEEIYSG